MSLGTLANKSLVDFPRGNSRSTEVCCNDKNLEICLNAEVNPDVLFDEEDISILDGGASGSAQCEHGIESTVVGLRTEGTTCHLTLYRRGALPRASLEDICAQVGARLNTAETYASESKPDASGSPEDAARVAVQSVRSGEVKGRSKGLKKSKSVALARKSAFS